jgi:hypothetical protein
MKILSRLHGIFSKQSGTEIAFLTDSIDQSVNDVVSHMSDMAVQSEITHATGSVLDLWGEKFGVYRESGELDDPYRTRVLGKVTFVRGTIPALISATKRALGDDTVVQIDETYQDLRIFNVSTFSGTGKFQDTDTVRLGVVKIIINKPTNVKLLEEIGRTRASGIRVIIEENLG